MTSAIRLRECLDPLPGRGCRPAASTAVKLGKGVAGLPLPLRARRLAGSDGGDVMANKYWDCGDPPGPFTDEEMAAAITGSEEVRFGLRGNSFTATREDGESTREGEGSLVTRRYTVAMLPSCQYPTTEQWSATYQTRVAESGVVTSEGREGVAEVVEQLEDIRDYFGID